MHKSVLPRACCVSYRLVSGCRHSEPGSNWVLNAMCGAHMSGRKCPPYLLFCLAVNKMELVAFDADGG